MKKAIVLFLALTFIICAGCSSADNSEGYTFTDDLGRKVSVNSQDKTAVLLGSFAQLWLLSGGEVCACPNDAWDDYDLGLPDTVVNLGNTENLSLELLMAAKPDFVIASTSRKQHTLWEEIFENAGITVAYFDVKNFEDYLDMLKICTDITGREDLYQTYGTELSHDIAQIIEESTGKYEGRTYLLLRASATYIRAKRSEDTVLGEMLNDFGCVNIADSDESLLESLSLESIIEINPTDIFIVQAGDDSEGMKKAVENMFSENPAWHSLDAVKEGRVHYMDKMLYNFKPNARWGEAYAGLEKILSEK